MALVITLSLIVLVTIATMAFFVRSMSNRTVESSRSNQILAKQLADTGIDYVAGQFLQEIASKSIATNINGVVTYLPTTNTFAVPQRPLPSSLTSDTNFANLIRRSVNESTNGIGETNASTHNTATASRNGRAISPGRWNAPLLVGGTGFTEAPNWLYVSRDGSVRASASTTAIGRFAYNVYNIGGLLDANAAGNPGLSGTNLAAIKGTLAGADLTVTGLSASAVGNLVAFRSPQATSGVAYTNYVAGAAKTGFLATVVTNGSGTGVTTNNFFTSRSDLIRYATLQNKEMTNALPYLTTFSRSVDGPSFTPDPSRPKVLSQTPALPVFGMDDVFNPSLISTSVQTAFTRNDGTRAKVGEPLIKKRFPLNRLSLIENAPAAVDASNPIYTYFGLTRSSATSPWTYNHGQADRILQLSEVAAAGREPDFFELLQACIPIGSLGKSLGKTCAYTTSTADDIARDVFTKYQILQIGANLIDQWDADSYPTAISLADANNFSFSGIENLPYLTRIFSNLYKDNGPDPANPSGPPVELMSFFLMPEVWNPHQDAPNPSAEPAQLRFVMEGSYNFLIQLAFRPGGTFSADGSRGILFNRNGTLSEPTLLDRTGTAIDPRDTKSPSNGPPFVGMLLGSFVIPSGEGFWNQLLPDLSYHLQYNRGGQWITYSSMRKNDWRFYLGGLGWRAVGIYRPAWCWIGRSDPRVERFGYILSVDYAGAGSGTAPNETQRPNSASSGAQVWDNYKLTGTYPGWHPHTNAAGDPGYGWQYSYLWGLLTGNKPTSQTWYADADGVSRRGDAAFSNGSLGEPMTTGNLASRPVILNRPFRSVGEMGYAGRDLPWKTLDFFTADSADGALLDAFCINENNAGHVVAGKVDLNTRQSVVLEALLVGAAKLPGSEISPAQAQSVAAQIHSAVATNPLANLADLAKSITSNPTVAGALGSSADASIKVQREVLTRALSDVGQVRTWNLLADIIAQAGRFPPASSTGPGDFVVEAEKRIWASVAIDRPTAALVNSQTEVIHE